MSKISVIMPVYNTAEYLPQAVESVFNQTFSNWELILIDDGSTDNSLDVCKHYESIDNRIKVFHKNNEGQGVARNLGLSKCSGDYVMYLDSDDWIDNDCMDFLLNMIEKYGADVAECGCRSVASTGEVKEYVKKDTIIMNAEECIDHLAYDDAVGPGACSKLFDIRILRDKTFPHLRAYEDYQFIYDICTDVKKYVHVYEPKWNYFHRANSTMTSEFSLRNIALVDAQKGICNLLKAKGFKNQFLQAQKILCSKQFYILYLLLESTHLEDHKLYADELRQSILDSYHEYMSNPAMGRNKMMLRLLRYTPSLTWRTALKLKFR